MDNGLNAFHVEKLPVDPVSVGAMTNRPTGHTSVYSQPSRPPQRGGRDGYGDLLLADLAHQSIAPPTRVGGDVGNNGTRSWGRAGSTRQGRNSVGPACRAGPGNGFPRFRGPARQAGPTGPTPVSSLDDALDFQCVGISQDLDEAFDEEMVTPGDRLVDT